MERIAAWRCLSLIYWSQVQLRGLMEYDLYTMFSAILLKVINSLTISYIILSLYNINFRETYAILKERFCSSATWKRCAKFFNIFEYEKNWKEKIDRINLYVSLPFNFFINTRFDNGIYTKQAIISMFTAFMRLLGLIVVAEKMIIQSIQICDSP